MLGNIFWSVVTSYFALSIDLGILLLAAAVGFLPLVRYLPAVGLYVPVAKVVAIVLALIVAFLIGFRVADNRAEVVALNGELKNLRATIAAQKADLDNAAKSAADENARAKLIEANADAQHQSDAEYIASLQSRPACLLDDSDLQPNGRVRTRSATATGSGSSAAIAAGP